MSLRNEIHLLSNNLVFTTLSISHEILNLLEEENVVYISNLEDLEKLELEEDTNSEFSYLVLDLSKSKIDEIGIEILEKINLEKSKSHLRILLLNHTQIHKSLEFLLLNTYLGLNVVEYNMNNIF